MSVREYLRKVLNADKLTYQLLSLSSVIIQDYFHSKSADWFKPYARNFQTNFFLSLQKVELKAPFLLMNPLIIYIRLTFYKNKLVETLG